jgi:casein kinase 1
MEHGRQDDLESLTYVLIYFLRCSLPWQGLDFKGHNLIAKSKQQNSTDDLCKRLSQEFHTFLDYSHSLSFYNKPDYNYFCGLFGNSLSQVELESDIASDWDVPNDAIDEHPCMMQRSCFSRLKYTDSLDKE